MEQSVADKLLPAIVESTEVKLPEGILEYSIDQFLDDGVLKDIPGVAIVLSLRNFYTTISDRMILGKLLRFMTNLERHSLKEIEEFRHKLDHTPGRSREIGEHLLCIIDQIDSIKKPEALARCFSHFLTNDITYEDYLNFAHAIRTCSISDLENLLPDPPKFKFSDAGRLVASGIAEFGLSKSESEGELPEMAFRISSRGKGLQKILKGEYRAWKAANRPKIDLERFFA